MLPIIVLVIFTAPVTSLTATLAEDSTTTESGENVSLTVSVADSEETHVRLGLPPGWTLQDTQTRETLIATAEGYREGEERRYLVAVPPPAAGVYHPRVKLIRRHERDRIDVSRSITMEKQVDVRSQVDGRLQSLYLLNSLPNFLFSDWSRMVRSMKSSMKS
jgi:hypothetical protein